MDGMETQDQTADRLESLWRKLGAEIKEKEQALDRLKERFRKLDEARLVILEELSSGPIAVRVAEAQAESLPPPLREAAVQFVRDAQTSDGISASDVTNALSKRGLGDHVTPRVFYSMVYLSLMRAADGGELRVKKGPRGRLFLPAPKDKSLFQNEREAAH